MLLGSGPPHNWLGCYNIYQHHESWSAYSDSLSFLVVHHYCHSSSSASIIHHPHSLRTHQGNHPGAACCLYYWCTILRTVLEPFRSSPQLFWTLILMLLMLVVVVLLLILLGCWCHSSLLLLGVLPYYLSLLLNSCLIVLGLLKSSLPSPPYSSCPQHVHDLSLLLLLSNCSVWFCVLLTTPWWSWSSSMISSISILESLS